MDLNNYKYFNILLKFVNLINYENIHYKTIIIFIIYSNIYFLSHILCKMSIVC